jgi:diguanylate cyclase (GGDEF)-like protein
MRTLRRIAVVVNASNAVVIASAPYLRSGPEAERELYAAVAVVLLVNALALMVTRSWASWFIAALAIGVPNVAVLTLLAVTRHAGSLTLLLLWSALASPYFRSRATALANLAVIGLGLGVAVIVSPDPRVSAFTWIVTVLACVLCSITVRVIAEHNDAMMISLNERARRDQLTGLLNRRGFDERLDAAWGAQDGADLSIVFFDLDHFKAVNDLHGHPVGDGVLRMFAEVLRGHADGEDVAARTGGEEFGLVMPGRGATEALGRAGAVVKAFDALRIPVDGGVLRCTVSAGVAARAPRHTSASHLCRDADRALYAAKESGRGRAVLHVVDPVARAAEG